MLFLLIYTSLPNSKNMFFGKIFFLGYDKTKNDATEEEEEKPTHSQLNAFVEWPAHYIWLPPRHLVI